MLRISRAGDGAAMVRRLLNQGCITRSRADAQEVLQWIGCLGFSNSRFFSSWLATAIRSRSMAHTRPDARARALLRFSALSEHHPRRHPPVAQPSRIQIEAHPQRIA